MTLLDELLARRLLFLCGKGGVGKSVVGTALALKARERGKRALLVEIDTPAAAEASRYLGAGPIGHAETELLPGLFGVNLDPKRVMDEYVGHVVKVDLLARRIVDSPVYERFFAAAPGLPELMLLGKIMTLVEAHERWSRRPRYDLLIVDAPATGHGLAFLKVPLAASNAVPVGPVGANARRILALLRDAARTALLLVAIPEEMAVVEAIEFRQMSREQLGLEPRALVLNACHERRFAASHEAEILRLTSEGARGRLPGGVSLEGALAAARRHMRRVKLTRFYERRLARTLSEPVLRLPFLFRDHLTLDDLRLLSSRLEAEAA